MTNSTEIDLKSAGYNEIKECTAPGNGESFLESISKSASESVEENERSSLSNGKKLKVMDSYGRNHYEPLSETIAYSYEPDDELPYACAHEGCFKKFKTQGYLFKHQGTHLTVKRYACKEEGCQMRFSTHSQLYSHVKNHKKLYGHVCTHAGCEMKFLNASGLNRHLKSHEKQKELTCKLCRHACFSAARYLRHMALVHNEKEALDKCGTKCDFPECNHVAPNKTQLSRHKLIHPSAIAPKPYVCVFPNCKKSFTSLADLTAHKETAHAKKTCYLCKKTFKSQSLLSSHVKLHKKVAVSQLCPFGGCSKVYYTHSNLFLHYQTAHLYPNQKRICPIDGCGRGLSHLCSFKRHLLRVHGVEDFSKYDISPLNRILPTTPLIVLEARLKKLKADLASLGQECQMQREHHEAPSAPPMAPEAPVTLLDSSEACQTNKLDYLSQILDPDLLNNPNVKIYNQTVSLFQKHLQLFYSQQEQLPSGGRSEPDIDFGLSRIPPEPLFPSNGTDQLLLGREDLDDDEPFNALKFIATIHEFRNAPDDLLLDQFDVSEFGEHP